MISRVDTSAESRHLPLAALRFLPLAALRFLPLAALRSPIPAQQARSRKRRAAAATELAILLPFLFLMFAAAVDFGRIYFTTQTLQDCAEAGALYASGTAQSSSSLSQTTAAQNAACASGVSLAPTLQPENVSVTYSGAATTVTVQYDFYLLTPIFDSPIQLRRSVTLNQAPQPGN